MTNQEWIDMFRAIPEPEWGKIVLVLSNNSEVCVDALIRFDQNYLVMRGRVGGTIEESRGFVVPYHQIVYLRLERAVKIEEMANIFGESNVGGEAAVGKRPEVATPAVILPADPATASRQLMEKLRASRAAASGKTPVPQAN